MQQLAAEVGHYGLLAVFLNVLLSEAGLPLPAIPILVTLGALAAAGGNRISAIILAGVAGSLVADLAWYWAGRAYGRRVLGLLCRMSLSPDHCVRQTETAFLRIGPWSLLFAKFLPALSTVSVAMAGANRMPVAAFLVLNTLGALLLVAVPAALGLMFHDAIGDVLAALARFGKLGVLLILGALTLYVMTRWLRRHALLRELRMERITADELRGMIQQGHTPVILDVRPPEARAPDGMIPGALPAYGDEMDRALAAISRAQEIVVYCACPNEASAATAARRLKQAGFKNIRPLLGGVDAWVEAGGLLHTLSGAES